jgi:polysaccharide export outer membrane protein
MTATGRIRDLAGRAKATGRNLRMRAVAPGVALCLAAVLGGCNEKSFMDPSVTGRWTPTPTIMPILDRLTAIEDDTGDLVEVTDPVPGDLIPLPVSYRIAAGDALDVTLYDLIETNRPELYEVIVDARGAIELPQLGRIVVMGLTTEEATEVLKTAMKRLVAEPLVLVVAKAQRAQTFNIIGGVESPGPYFIPRADYRLLEAITAGGRVEESLVDYVYVIRQVPLSEDVTKGLGAPDTKPNPANPAPAGEKPKDLMNVIDSIAPPSDKPAPAGQPTPTPAPATPETKPAPAVPLPGEAPAPQATPATPKDQPRPAPVVELPDESKPAAPKAATPEQKAEEGGGWIFVNGKWVQVGKGGQASDAKAARATQDLITQRIIRVPLKGLLAGKQTLNIIIRPGDVVRVPQPPTGLVYVAGQVARPGPYQIPLTGGLTLLRAIDSAGGLGTIAIPERIELTRMIDRNREATIMVDGKAIAERTQPDVFLKPNDRINVGTNFWALPLAVIRNGFRASYGFGFVLDRNIGNDIFGPEPTNTIGN